MTRINLNSMIRSINCLGYDVFSGQIEELTTDQNQFAINTINAYSYVVAKRDQGFKEALMRSDVLLPDGFPIATAVRILSGKKIKKIAGEDIFMHLMLKLNSESGRAFFLGSSPQTLNSIIARAATDFPQVEVQTYSPPFNPKF